MCPSLTLGHALGIGIVLRIKSHGEGQICKKKKIRSEVEYFEGVQNTLCFSLHVTLVVTTLLTGRTTPVQVSWHVK